MIGSPAVKVYCAGGAPVDSVATARRLCKGKWLAASVSPTIALAGTLVSRSTTVAFAGADASGCSNRCERRGFSTRSTLPAAPGKRAPKVSTVLVPGTASAADAGLLPEGASMSQVMRAR